MGSKKLVTEEIKQAVAALVRAGVDVVEAWRIVLAARPAKEGKS